MATLLDDRKTAALVELRRLLGPKGFIDEPAALEPHLVEWRRLFHGHGPAALLPASTDEVAAVVGIAAKAGFKLVPQGGNTGLCQGALPYGDDQLVVSLKRMNRVRALDALNDAITVEAGCILATIQDAAEAADRLFPLSLAAEGSCMIGGNLSTNAGGINVVRYGMARDLVLGLEVVLPDGRVWNGLNGLRKDNTGYDLKQLFIGAEGTLGIITAATLKLFARPRVEETALVAVASPAAAIEMLARTKAATGDSVVAFELIHRICLDFVFAHVPGNSDPLAARHEWYVLLELAGGDVGTVLRERLEAMLGRAIEDGLALDATIAASTAQRRALWKLREAITEAQLHEGGSIKHDISVPISKVPDFIERAIAACGARMPDARPLAFGHIGDGNIHFNLSQPAAWPKAPKEAAAFVARWAEFNAIVHDIAVGLGGSISAEHGIGRLKREELAHYKSPVALDLMRAIKAALDPAGIMNPGKIL